MVMIIVFTFWARLHFNYYTVFIITIIFQKIDFIFILFKNTISDFLLHIIAIQKHEK